jgi:hypothetical protein
MHRRAAQSQQEMRQRNAMEAEVRRMPPEHARALVAELKQRPDDSALFGKVFRYYQVHSDVGGLSQLTLWYIANHPNGSVAPSTIHPAWSRVAWEKGADLWRRNLRQPDATPETWRRAARYLEGNDKAEAERVLLAAKEKYPNENWTSPLGELYALALLGARGPRADFNTVRETSAEQANTPFARSVRTKLAASQDVGLLVQTAQWVMAWSRPDRKGGAPLD